MFLLLESSTHTIQKRAELVCGGQEVNGAFHYDHFLKFLIINVPSKWEFLGQRVNVDFPRVQSSRVQTILSVAMG